MVVLSDWIIIQFLTIVGAIVANFGIAYLFIKFFFQLTKDAEKGSEYLRE